MATPERPLDVVVRFSTPIPDMTVRIDAPSTTSILTLKERIRDQLQQQHAAARLRLIHGGKVLSETAALSRSVQVTLPPPANSDGTKSEKAKGKQPLRATVQAARVYIHCSVGDVLTLAELSEESRMAQEADSALKSTTQAPSADTPGQGQAKQDHVTTTSAPRGFDRLLSAGFTASEVAALRAQFLAIQAHTHTPDTMPTGADLLALEERWLDNTSNPAAGGESDPSGLGSEEGGLEDMLYGNLVGFFWPIGAMCWLMREEGVWSRRRQIAVLSGFLVNLTFGFLRVMN
ncbi:hypothetical protein BAUCODRAFT_532297 [Lecanosticta acicola]|uniref:Ubiquitin-like domain-containing protein n=1 Tax=Lecanosticta acicola TaxID=111012 RepID=A0AAI9EFN2_9PEZI|nr:hypothetical protein BAUCODRAFT_532297 [Lecanosticta acicola]